MTDPQLKNIGVHGIVADARTQSRATINDATVEEYAEAWQAGVRFPPLDVFQSADGTIYLADGFHRLLAAKLARKATVQCRIFDGTARDAFLFACGVNGTHGLRRTNADKRHMVETLLGDAEWARWTDLRVADVCGVSHNLVAVVRRDLQKIANSPAALAKNEVRRGADGKEYPPSRKRKSRDTLPSDSNRETKVEGSSQARREKALAVVKELEKLLQVIGLYDNYASSLDAIRLDLSDSTGQSKVQRSPVVTLGMPQIGGQADLLSNFGLTAGSHLDSN